eukprot:7288537-Prymnesium_polylepis.1
MRAGQSAHVGCSHARCGPECTQAARIRTCSGGTRRTRVEPPPSGRADTRYLTRRLCFVTEVELGNVNSRSQR